MLFVSTGKSSVKVICNSEYEKFAGVNFTTLLCSPYLMLAEWPEINGEYCSELC
jgi:hypothetical protein